MCAAGAQIACLFFNHPDAIAAVPGEATTALLFYPQNLWVSFKKDNFFIKAMIAFNAACAPH